MARVSGLPSTTVALVHGLCLSGWALALLRCGIGVSAASGSSLPFLLLTLDLDSPKVSPVRPPKQLALEASEPCSYTV